MPIFRRARPDTHHDDKDCQEWAEYALGTAWDALGDAHGHDHLDALPWAFHVHQHRDNGEYRASATFDGRLVFAYQHAKICEAARMLAVMILIGVVQHDGKAGLVE
jgi:hypothetical protein